MIDTVLASVSPGETRVALLAGERVVELRHHRESRESVTGNLYLGRVARVVPGLQAAFVDIGLARDGFLNAADARPDSTDTTEAIGQYVHEGEAVIVQVTRDPGADKGARLTMRPAIAGTSLVITPARSDVVVSRRIADADERERLIGAVTGFADGGGFIVRTAAEGVSADELAREAEGLRDLWDDLVARRAQSDPPACLHSEPGPLEQVLRDFAGLGVARVITDSPQAAAAARRYCDNELANANLSIETWDSTEPLFEHYGVEEAIEEALDARVDLPSGASLIIEGTAALTAVDVNLGGSAGGRGGAETALAANLEAAGEIARQLRLRAIGGLIVIDFLHMTRDGHRRQVSEALAEALAGDRDASGPRGFTGLGLVEMTRRHTRPPLSGILCEPCGFCGRGHVASAETVALAAARAVLREARGLAGAGIEVACAPDVADALDPLAGALADAAGETVTVTMDDDRDRDSFEIFKRGNPR
jgi:ribonuclease G